MASASGLDALGGGLGAVDLEHLAAHGLRDADRGVGGGVDTAADRDVIATGGDPVGDGGDGLQAGAARLLDVECGVWGEAPSPAPTRGSG